MPPIYTDFLAADEIAAVRKPLPEASFLPPRLYYDTQFYDFEIDKVMMRNWLPVAHVSEFAENNTYVARDMFGEPIVVTRNDAGLIQSFSNVCRHRTARIVTGSGRFHPESKTIACPYHGWSYTADGALAGAPRMNRTSNFDFKNCRLPLLRTEIWQGFVFVSANPEAPSLSAQLATLERVLAPYRMADMTCVEFARYPVKWNWKVTLENFTEGYHQASVHAQSIEPYIPSHIQRYDDVDGPYNLFWMPTVSKKPLFDLVPPVEGLPPEYLETTVVVNIFPLFHVLIDSGAIFWLDWEPRSAADHDIRWRLLVPKSTAALPDFGARKLALETLMREVWAEDNTSCDGVNAGVRSRFAATGRPCYLEKSIHQLHNWLVDQYQA